jgi:hypothetical protein
VTPGTEGPRGIIEKITDGSGRNPFLVGLLCLIAACAGVYALVHVSLDAVPDLSDVQVIVYTDWEGRNPSLVEDQVTYPITSKFLGAPRIKAVRGLSMFGRSFVYVIFEDGTDLYWARSRVLEYLNSVRDSLPPGVNPTLGPDATGVGWVYEYALVDDSGRTNLAQMRSLQDWTLKYALGSVKGVAEVASIGGFVKQYQVNVDPNKLINHGVSLNDVVEAVRKSNSDVGGKSLEVSTTQYFIRGRGYIHSLDDLRQIPLKASDGTPLTVNQVATVELGPDLREGLAEFNGQGEEDHAVEGLASSGCANRAGVRPFPIDLAFDRYPQGQTHRGKHHRQFGLRRFPLAFPQRPRRHHHVADGDPALLHPVCRHAPDREHHVAGWHCDRHRRDGRCGHYHDRERAQGTRTRAVSSIAGVEPSPGDRSDSSRRT